MDETNINQPGHKEIRHLYRLWTDASFEYIELEHNPDIVKVVLSVPSENYRKFNYVDTRQEARSIPRAKKELALDFVTGVNPDLKFGTDC